MKRTYILICCIIIIFLVLVITFFQQSKTNNNKKQSDTIQTPTPIAVKKTIPTPTLSIGYTNTNNDSTFANAIDNKPQLSIADAAAKQNLITLLITQNKDATYQTTDFKIMYIKTFDMFQVEIETTDIRKAENETVVWFAANGISKDGLCKLPVQFYPNFQINQLLKQQNIQVPPLAIGC